MDDIGLSFYANGSKYYLAERRNALDNNDINLNISSNIRVNVKDLYSDVPCYHDSLL